MPGKRSKLITKINVIYPGVSQQLIFDQNKQRIQKDKSETVINSNRFEKRPFFEPTLTDTKFPTNNGAGLQDRSFDLDWIDYKQQRHSTLSTDTLISENKTEISRNIFKLKESEQNLSISKLQGNKTADHRFNISTLGKMQSNAAVIGQISGNPGSSHHHLNIDSTSLDMSNELTNQLSGDYFVCQNLDGQLTDGTPEAKQTLSDDYNQLDEPIMDTLLRDLSGIYNKMKIIALPLSSYDIYKVVLKGWDLWGPLMLCTFLAFNLHHSDNKDNHAGPHFADVFVLVWFGACIVSLNYRLMSISSVNNQIVSNQMILLEQGNTMQQSTSNYGEPNVGDPMNLKDSPDRNHSKFTMSTYGTPFQTLLSPPSIFQLMCVFGYCLVAPCFGLIILKMFSFNRLFFERIIVGLLFGFAWPTFCSIKILIRYQHPEKRALAIYPIGLFYFVLSCMIILNH